MSWSVPRRSDSHNDTHLEKEFQSAISSLAESRIPVIAAIHGLCVGLGVDITSACDIRLAAEDSTFAIAVGHLRDFHLRLKS